MILLSKGIDYAFSPHPSVAALKANGVTFACRYISSFAPNDHNGKNLLAAEKAALLGGGIAVVVVVEEGANRMLGGHSAGVADAQHASAVVTSLGMPGIPVYFACDFDATADDQARINAYLDGAATVLGKSRVGVYGGYYVVKRAFDGKHCAYGWQTRAWSGGQWDSRAQLRQGETTSLGGASVDWDESRAADFGQWPRPGPPNPSPVLSLALKSAGAAVGIVQTRLNVHGVTKPALAVDSNFGALTDKALRAFQSARKLAGDGITGPATWAALRAAPPAVGPTPPPAPKGLAASSVSLAVTWQPVTVGGTPAASYTVKAVGQNGKVYASLTTPTTSALITGLTHGWTYDIVVWANGGTVVADSATLKVTVLSAQTEMPPIPALAGGGHFAFCSAITSCGSWPRSWPACSLPRSPLPPRPLGTSCASCGASPQKRLAPWQRLPGWHPRPESCEPRDP